MLSIDCLQEVFCFAISCRSYLNCPRLCRTGPRVFMLTTLKDDFAGRLHLLSALFSKLSTPAWLVSPQQKKNHGHMCIGKMSCVDTWSRFTALNLRFEWNGQTMMLHVFNWRGPKAAIMLSNLSESKTAFSAKSSLKANKNTGHYMWQWCALPFTFCVQCY